MKHNSSDHSWARRIFTWTIWMCVRTCNILLHQPKSGTVQNVTSVFSRWECTVSVGLALGRSPFSSFLCIRSTVRVFITRIVLLLLYGRPLGILCWCKKKKHPEFKPQRSRGQTLYPEFYCTRSGESSYFHYVTMQPSTLTFREKIPLSGFIQVG